MDISELYTADLHEAGAEMQVKDENGELLDCFLLVVGIDSKLWRKTFNDGKRQLLSGEGENVEANVMAEATIGWRGFESDGVELDFSKESILALYVNAPYIAEQVDKFIANRANFTKGKATN